MLCKSRQTGQMQNLLVCLTQSTPSSQSSPKTQLRALGELGVRQLGIGVILSPGFGKIPPSGMNVATTTA